MLLITGELNPTIFCWHKTSKTGARSYESSPSSPTIFYETKNIKKEGQRSSLSLGASPAHAHHDVYKLAI